MSSTVAWVCEEHGDQDVVVVWSGMKGDSKKFECPMCRLEKDADELQRRVDSLVTELDTTRAEADDLALQVKALERGDHDA